MEIIVKFILNQNFLINKLIHKAGDIMHIFFKRLSQERHRLSQLETQVLDYIIQNPNHVINISIDEFSKVLFVSTATISRTCRQLGFKGFQDMKYILHTYKQQEPVHITTPSSSLFSKHMERIQNEMDRTLQLIHEEKIEKAVHYIEESRHVEFFGVGNSLPPCVDAARKLTASGKLCNTRSDWDELRNAAYRLNASDLAILVSYSGETSSILEFAHILKERNVKTIAITGQHNNHLQKEVHLSLQAHVTHCYYDDIDMSSRFPLSVVLDFIILSYLHRETGQ